MLKIHEFVAHTGDVGCLRIGGKSGRIMATGGSQDNIVNIWAIGKTTPLLSLSGHTCAITSVDVDWHEELLVAGSAAGTIKLWDLEHSKVVRSLLNPHTSNPIKTLEFHPFGDFFASACKDAVKVWDLRRKGSIQSYTNDGGKDSFELVRITPDGRWIATTLESGMIKLWDMTAGKLVHTLTYTTRVVDVVFSPRDVVMIVLESGGTISVIDLKSFHLIANASIKSCKKPHEPGVPKSAAFHSNGKIIIIALEDGLQSWTFKDDNSLIMSDNIPVLGWEGIRDIKILGGDENKLVGGSIDQNFVGVWGLDLDPLEAFSGDAIPSFNSFEEENTSGVDALQSVNLLPRMKSQTSVHESIPTTNTIMPAISKLLDNKSKSNDSLVVAQQHTILPKIEAAAALAAVSSQIRNTQITPNAIRRARKASIDEKYPGEPLDPAEKLLAAHTTTSNTLQKRLVNLKILKRSWDNGGIKSTIETMVLMKDSAVCIDILKLVNGNPRLIGTLELCQMLIPVVQELLFEVHQGSIRALVKGFASVILGQSDMAFVSPGIDVAREERYDRCAACRTGFIDLRITLEELKKSPGYVGVAVRDSLKDLKVF